MEEMTLTPALDVDTVNAMTEGNKPSGVNKPGPKPKAAKVASAGVTNDADTEGAVSASAPAGLDLTPRFTGKFTGGDGSCPLKAKPGIHVGLVRHDPSTMAAYEARNGVRWLPFSLAAQAVQNPELLTEDDKSHLALYGGDAVYYEPMDDYTRRMQAKKDAAVAARNDGEAIATQMKAQISGEGLDAKDKHAFVKLSHEREIRAAVAQE